MKFRIGDSASFSRTITSKDIAEFAELSGDTNPVHTDEEYAAKTRFGRTVAHGMFSAALISAVLGSKLPGPGTIYLSQTLQFRAPVYVGDTITAKVTVDKIRDDKRLLVLETSCRNQRNELVVEGEAVVIYDEPLTPGVG